MSFFFFPAFPRKKSTGFPPAHVIHVSWTKTFVKLSVFLVLAWTGSFDTLEWERPQDISSNLLLQGGSSAMRSDQVTQGLIQSGIEILQGWRLHSLSEEPVPVMDCEEVSPYIQLQMTKWPFQPQKLLFSCSGSFLILFPNFHSGILTYQTPALIQLLLVPLFLSWHSLTLTSHLHYTTPYT